MNILLVRHAQSESNVDVEVLTRKTNVAVNLTDVGRQQAIETANFLVSQNLSGSIKLWNSPYERTRETAQSIADQLVNFEIDKEESIYLTERQFGLVDDAKDYGVRKSEELAHYRLHKAHSHDFFARPPLGESPFDVCCRIDFFMKSVLENKKNIGYDTHIIVAHGALIRAFVMMYLGKTYEYYRDMPLPKNASVHKLVDGVYLGEIFHPK